MMKKSNKIYLLSLLSFFVIGCTSILDEEPTTFYNEEQTFSTEAGVETAVNGLWYSFGAPEYYGSSWHGLINPISGKFFSNQGASRDATSLNCSPINTWLTRLWPGMFSTVNNANVIIANLEDSELNLPNRDFALGQAYLIRGIAYFDLVRLFGGVPIKTEPSTSVTLHSPRNSVEEVYAQVIQDLEKAKELLPDFGEYRSERPATYVANVYLAKVYMTLAGQDDGDVSLWQNAKTELAPVIGKYSLTPTYAELFVPGNENTSESILELQYDHIGAIRNSDMIRTYTPSKSLFAPSNQNTFGRVRPNKETFDDHVNRYADDPRIDVTYVYDGYERSNGGTQTIYPARTSGNQGFVVLAKFFDPTYNGTTTMRNYILARYADVLLMMAEIENEISGPDAAYQYVNQVLARARDIDGDGNSDAQEPADWSGFSKDEFRNRILQERRYEMLGEGQDWFDTRRRGYDYFLQEVVTKHNTHPTFDATTDFVYPVSIKNMLLPIPSTEISGNQAITPADQNPGY